MGFCHYQFNPSELYRRTAPGTAPETVCGARTFPAADEPEIVVVQQGMGPDGAVYGYVPTGRMITRATDDPYCPGHGGSPPPPPPPVTVAELDRAYQAYQDLAARYQGQPGAAIPAQATAPAALEAPAGLAPAPAAGDVTAGDVTAAAQRLQDLAGRALLEGAAR